MSKLTMGRFAFESGVALDPCAAGATPCAKRSATGGGARSSPTSSDGSCRRSRQTTATSEATWRWYFTIRLKCSEPSPRIAGNASPRRSGQRPACRVVRSLRQGGDHGEV